MLVPRPIWGSIPSANPPDLAGTTTASYYATTSAPSTNLLSTICQTQGQRAFIGRTNMDTDLQPAYYQDSSPAFAVDATKSTISHVEQIDPKNSLVKPIITPRFAPSCSKELLAGLGELSKESRLPVQTHISENKDEVALVKKLFPEQDSYAAVYDHFNLLTERTVLAHAIHLSPDEIQLVKQRKAKISHCPVSNSSLSSGLCPVRKYLDEGIEVGLGTDMSGAYPHLHSHLPTYFPNAASNTN